MFLIVLIRNHLFVRARGHFIQPIGPIVSALVFPRFASFSSSSIAFLSSSWSSSMAGRLLGSSGGAGRPEALPHASKCAGAAGRKDHFILKHLYGSPGASQVVLVVKNPPANAGDIRDEGSIPGMGRSPGGGHGNPLQYSCLENPMDRGAWRAIVHRVAESDMPEVTQCAHAWQY